MQTYLVLTEDSYGSHTVHAEEFYQDQELVIFRSIFDGKHKVVAAFRVSRVISIILKDEDKTNAN